jgi:hypothetical protein
MAKTVQLTKIASILVFAGMFFLLSYQAATDSTLPDPLAEIFKKKQWITVLSRYVPSEGSYIVVKIGDEEKIVYRGDPRHSNQGLVAISPKGEKLVFAQFVEPTGSEQAVRKVCTIRIDGSEYNEVLDIKDVFYDIAWSHDQEKIAFLGELQSGFYGLVVLDVSTQPVVIAAQRPLRRGMSFIKLTSQAWAPDNERLVYVNAQGHMIILNVKSDTEENLGQGDDPTWSRDGAFIAYRAEGSGKAPGDYFLLSVMSSHQQEKLLSNKRSAADIIVSRGYYLGKPIWSPDGRFIMIMRIVSLAEFQQPYVIDLKTGDVEALPIGSMGDMRSWGGKP